MLAAAHPAGCTCNYCSGPALWNTVLNASLPSFPEPSASVAGTDSHRPQSKFRLSRWLSLRHNVDSSNERDVEGLSKPHRQPLVIETLLSGQTKSPITLDDFRAFLRSSKTGDRLGDMVALDFLVTFKAYKARFFALPTADQSPHPYAVIESLSKMSMDQPSPFPLDSTASPVAFSNGFEMSARTKALPARPPAAAVDSRTSHSRNNSAASNRSLPLNRQPARARAATFDSIRTPVEDDEGSNKSTSRAPSRTALQNPLPLILDPELQPMRAELQVIIDTYLSGHSSSLLMTIVSPSTVSLALSETELTTHPSTLEPVANALTAHLNARVLPKFFDAAVINLSAATSRGRLLMALFIFAIAVALTVVFIVKRSLLMRWTRLALTPLYVASIGYMIGSQTSLCFWLAWRGTREEKQYEEEERTAVAERQFRHSSESTVYDHTDLCLSQTWGTDPLVKTYSIYTINAGEKTHRLSTWKGTRLVRATSSFEMVTSSPVTEKKDRLIRMTGTATSTVPVEDISVRRAQVRIAVTVTAWLVLGTVAAMSIVVSIF